MSSLASLPTLFVLIFWPTSVVEVTFDVLPSFFFMKVSMSALTSAKTNGASYLNMSSPSLMALTGMGPQQYTPEARGQCRDRGDGATLVWIYLDQKGPHGFFITVTFLLWCGITGLPAIKIRLQVRPGHPALHPAVIVPTDTTQTLTPGYTFCFGTLIKICHNWMWSDVITKTALNWFKLNVYCVNLYCQG